jgi:c-di-GMP-related signal transduction protein
MPNRYQDFFLARQPILDRRGRVVAYELLYRAGGSSQAGVTDDVLATSRVITRSFGDLGVRTVLGGRQGFINLDAASLMSGMIESLPHDQVVLELLETIEIDTRVIARCRELKARGFKLALDDFFHYSEAYDAVLDLIDIVKIDIQRLDHDSLSDLVSRLRLWPAKLLAEKVQTLERPAMPGAGL